MNEIEKTVILAREVLTIETDKKRNKIKRVVKEYFERMLRLSITLTGCSTDNLIDCPKCGHHRTIQWNHRHDRWECLSFDCFFEFPNDLIPPNPNDLRNFLRKIIRRRKDEK